MMLHAAVIYFPAFMYSQCLVEADNCRSYIISYQRTYQPPEPERPGVPLKDGQLMEKLGHFIKGMQDRLIMIKTSLNKGNLTRSRALSICFCSRGAIEQ